LTDSVDGLLYKHLHGVEHPLDIKKKEMAEKLLKQKKAKQEKQEKKKKKKKKNESDPSSLEQEEECTCTPIPYESTKEDSEIENNDDDDDDNNKEEEATPEPETKFCWVDQTQVYATSMHCRYCDKCVQDFDHHCMWLNTCIGGRNYGYFFKSVWCLFLFTSSHLASVIVHLVLYFLDVADVKDLTTDWMGLGDGSDNDNDNTTLSKAIIIINIAFTILLLMVVSMIFQLLSFHLKLRSLKLTTYQFILQDSEQKRKDAKLDIVIEERRSDEIVRLSRMGRNWGVYSLKMYRMGICRGLDPIRKVVLKEQREEEERQRRRNLENSDDGGDQNGDQNGHQQNGGKKNGFQPLNGTSASNDEENGHFNGNGSEDAPTFVKVNGN